MPKTPTKLWMKRCVTRLKKSKKTKTPAKLCGWVWYHQMTPKSKMKAYREELKSKKKNRSDMAKRTSSVESKLGITKKSPKRVSVRVCRKYDLSSPMDYLYSSSSRYKSEWSGRVPKSCEICKCDLKTCFVDGKTKMGPWAIMCEKCHDKYGHGLGVGKGQKYEIKPEDKKSRNISKYKANPVRRSVAAEYKKLKVLMSPKHVNKRIKKIKVKYGNDFDPNDIESLAKKLYFYYQQGAIDWNEEQLPWWDEMTDEDKEYFREAARNEIKRRLLKK